MFSSPRRAYQRGHATSGSCGSRNPMHPECVEEKARLTMSRVGPTLGMHGGVLTGGTGLALHLGHRISGDLEFYTQQVFRPSGILEELRGLAGVVESVTMGDDAMIVQADGARLLLMRTLAPFGEPTIRLNGCDVAGVVDIAAMKLSLIHISEPTRLGMISYAVFCLKKKKKKQHKKQKHDRHRKKHQPHRKKEQRP